MKKAFTLVELLGVITILGILAIIAIPPINKTIRENSENLYRQQIKNIELAAANWGTDNPYLLPDIDGDVIYIALGSLKVKGYVEMDIKNPKNGTLFPNDMLIEITKEKKQYLYDVLEDSGSSSGGQIDVNSPLIVLKGPEVMHVQLNETFTDPGVAAMTADGVRIKNVVATITQNGTTVSSVNTKVLGRYEIVYQVTDQNIAATVRRTVIVEDTVKPVLMVNGKQISHTMTVEAGSFTVPSYTVTDNSQFTGSTYASALKVTVTNGVNASVEGEYFVDYKAVDAAGNETLLRLTVTVADTVPPTITISPTTVSVPYQQSYDLLSRITQSVVDNGTGVRDVTVTLDGVGITNTKDLKVGTYTLIYTARDNAKKANTASATLTLTITG